MAHSAHPELGESAIENFSMRWTRFAGCLCRRIRILGRTTINIGNDLRGRAPNIIPDAAKAELAIRLVGDGRKMDRTLRNAVGARAEVREILELPAMHFKSLDGFPNIGRIVHDRHSRARSRMGANRSCLDRAVSTWRTRRRKKFLSANCLAGRYLRAMTRMLLSRAEAHHA